MLRVFVYEFVTGGGWWSQGNTEPPPPSLAREGAAMLHAVLADFTQLSNATVVTMRDARLPVFSRPGEQVAVGNASAERQAVQELASMADWSLIIAPEFEGLLAERARWVETAGGKLLGPSPDVIELCADKQRTCVHLQRHDIRTPRGLMLSSEESPADGELANLHLPWVLKPVDGAGSQDTQLVETLADAAYAMKNLSVRWWRIEEYQPGQPASVACLCGPNGIIPLPPCTQEIAADGTFAYLGGRCPLPEPLAPRATRLAVRALSSLPNPRGYFGVDLILGPATDGSLDTVIEINPRLTTSYVGLRALSRTNLMGALLDVMNGQSVSVQMRAGDVEFRADGTIKVR